MSSFISDYLDFTKSLESPGSFFLWSSFACVGAALRYNVYLKQGPKIIYPNIYVLLIADSGIARKGTPLDIVSNLLRVNNSTKVIGGHTSIQAVLQDLGNNTYTDSKNGNQLMGGACLLSAEELAAYFAQDPNAMTLLTDIYDARSIYEYNLKSGRSVIKNLCVSMLAGSNEIHLRKVYDNTQVYGGLMARTFFIKPDERRPANPLLNSISHPFNGHYDTKRLTDTLKEIGKLKGEFVVHDDAREEYEKWYISLHNEYESKNDKSGVIARIHTGVLKISMILAVGRTLTIELKKEHMEESIAHCKRIIPNYEVFTMSSGKASDSQIGAILFTELLDDKNKNKVSRRLFIRQYWTEVDEDQFDILIKKLETAGLITENFDTSGTDLIFSLTDIGREIVKKRIEEKKNKLGGNV